MLRAEGAATAACIFASSDVFGFLEFLAYFAPKAQVLQAYFAPKAQVLQEQVLFLL